MRNERQNKILSLIAEVEIDTQTGLANALTDAGFQVTQATVSRDIKELGLIKVAGEIKKYRYASQKEARQFSKLATLFKESVLTMDTAMNLIVIKTFVGGANAACLLLDKLELPNVVGTLAGEDTILVIVKTTEDVPAVFQMLKEYI